MGLLSNLPEELFLSILLEWIDDIHSYSLLDVALTNHQERPLLLSLYEQSSFLVRDEVNLSLLYQDDSILSYVNWLNQRHLKLKKMFLPLSSLSRLVSLSPLITSQLHEIEVYQTHYEQYNHFDYDRPEEAYSILDLQSFLLQCPNLISLNLQGWEGLTDDDLTALTDLHSHRTTDSSTHNSTDSSTESTTLSSTHSSYSLPLERLEVSFSSNILSMINLIEFITSFHKSLLHLSIDGYLLTENYLTKLTVCQKLESLLIPFSLSYHSEEDFLTFLHEFQSLKELTVSIHDDRTVNERMLLRIAHQHSHTLISFGIMGMSVVLSMKTVKEILSICPYLITFQCMNCTVQVINAKEIVKIEFNNIEKMEVKDVVMLLALDCHSTKTLDLSFTQPISSNDLLEVARTVGIRLQSLDVVVDDDYHDTMMMKIGRLCPFLRHLTIRSISCIQLSDQFLEDLSIGLKHLTSITLFGLRNITHKGLASIVRERAGHLEELRVTGSDAIIDDDFLLLLEHSCGNCLKSLTLRGTIVSAEGVVAMMKRNSFKCLNSCILDQNVISKVEALWKLVDDVHSPLYQYWMQRLSGKTIFVM